MAEYIYEDEQGNEYVYTDDEDSTPAGAASDELPDYNAFTSAAPASEPDKPASITDEGYGERFMKEMGSAKGLKDAVMGIPKNLLHSMKSVYDAVVETPENLSKIVSNPEQAFSNKSVRKALGEVGKVGASYNPFFFLTEPLYEKGLQAVDPENFPPTTPEEDAANVRNQVATGAAVVGAPRALQAGSKGISAAANFLKDKLGDKIVPEQTIPAFREKGRTLAEKVIPETVETTTEPPKIPGFDESVSPAARQKSLRRTGRVDPNDPTRVTDKLTSAIDDFKSEEHAPGDVLSRPPEASLAELKNRNDILLRRRDELINRAEQQRPKGKPEVVKETRVIPGEKMATLDAQGREQFHADRVVESSRTLPPRGKIAFSNTERYIRSLPEGSTERMVAEETFGMKRAEFDHSWDGNLVDLNKRKMANDDFAKPGYNNRGNLDARQRVEQKVALRMADDMRLALEQRVPGLDNLNRDISNILTVKPFAEKRMAAGQKAVQAGGKTTTKVTPGSVEPAHSEIGKWVDEQVVPEQRTPGAWASKVNAAAKILAPAIGYVKGGGVLGAMAGIGVNEAAKALGGASNVIAKGAGGVGAAADAAKRLGSLGSTLASITAPTLANGGDRPLPRDTERLTQDDIATLLMKTSQSPQAIIAQQLIKKMQSAMRSEDMDTVEKIHSDLARLFPDEFEPGQGVNGKVFYPDEQKKHMDLLIQLHRMGKIDSIHLAKQRNAFNNPQDGRILPVDDSVYSPSSPPANHMVNGVRQYAY